MRRASECAGHMFFPKSLSLTFRRAAAYFACTCLAFAMLAASAFAVLEIFLDLVQILSPLQYGQLGFVTRNLHGYEGALFWRILAAAVFFAIGSTAWFVRPKKLPPVAPPPFQSGPKPPYQ